MKKILLATIMTSQFAFAQNTSTVTTPKPETQYEQNGFQMGLSYMNMTDIQYGSKYKYESKTSSYTYEDNHYLTETYHTSLVGLKLGYNKMPEKGLGFSTGITAFFSTNNGQGKEVYDPYTLIIPDASLSYSFNQKLVGYAGANVGMFTSPGYIAKNFAGTPGLQAGLTLRLIKGLNLSAGYTVIRGTMPEKTRENEYGKLTSSAEYQMGGFTTNMAYTF